jgi:hypothetical protein
MSKEIPFDQDKKAPMLEIEYISTNMASKFINASSCGMETKRGY